MKTLLAALLAAAVTTGCGRRPAIAHYRVGPECHPRAELFGCDAASPPRCAKIAMTFDKGCEQIVAKR